MSHGSNEDVVETAARCDASVSSTRIEVRGAVGNQAAHQTVHGDVITHQHDSSVDLRDRIPVATDAPFNAYRKQHDAECLPRTRMEILLDIYKWADGDGRHVCWLNGMVGTGKSTIAMTVAHTLHDRGRLGASFFFSRGGGDIASAKKFFGTIAMQLARALPGLLVYLQEAVTEEPNIANQSLRDQWRKLILEPLRKMQLTPPTPAGSFVIVVDALDECDSEDDVKRLLQLFTEANQAENQHGIRLLFFLTSRPEKPILTEFHAIPCILRLELELHNVSRDLVDRDISRFYDFNFAKIRRDVPALSPDWPGKSTVHLLTAQAQGLFIYAATVCRFILSNSRYWTPQQLLESFVSQHDEPPSKKRRKRLPSTTPTSHLDRIYVQVLQQALDGSGVEDQQMLAEELREIVGSLALLSTPLSIPALSSLLDLEEEVIRTWLDRLSSVVIVSNSSIDEPARFLHPSFPDFLLNPSRCDSEIFCINSTKGHQALFGQCMRILSDDKAGLKRNMCGVQDAGALVDDIVPETIAERIPSALQYASKAWAHHLTCSNALEQYAERLLSFLRQHFLHWLECMSLNQEIPTALHIVLSLIEQLPKESSACRFLSECLRFVFYFISMISRTPLQLYVSALAFTPRYSVIRQHFGQELTVVAATLGIPRVWSPLLQIVDDKCPNINLIKFSVDGKLIAASFASGKTIRISDAFSGVTTLSLEGRSLYNMAFHPNGKVITTSWNHKYLRHWDLITGVCQETEDYDEEIVDLHYSRDDRFFLVAFTSGRIILRNLQTRCDSLFQCSGAAPTLSTTLSPDGNELLAWSFGRYFHRWHSVSRAPLSTPSDVSKISAAAYSSDDQTIAFVTGDSHKQVILWNRHSGHEIRDIVSSTMITDIFFTFNTRILVLVCDHDFVQMWDIHTRSWINTLPFCRYTWAAACSPSAMLLATFSTTNSLTGSFSLWELPTTYRDTVEERSSKNVTNMAFSYESKRMAITAGKELHLIYRGLNPEGDALTRCNGLIRHVDFSSDGERILFEERGEDESVYRVVDLSNRKELMSWVHLRPNRPVAFCAHGTKIAITARKELKIYSVGSGRVEMSIFIEQDILRRSGSAFSPSGDIFAMVSADATTLQVWDLTQSPIHYDTHTIGTIGNRCVLRVLHFSPTGRYIAIIATYFRAWERILLWDVQSRSLSRHLDGSSFGRLRCPTFTKDETMLAAAGPNHIHLWNMGTGARLKVPHRFRSELTRLNFNYTDSCIDVDKGRILVPHSPVTESFARNSNSSLPELSIHGEWVYNGDRKIMWIPEEYRPEKYYFFDGAFILKPRLRKPVMIKFSRSQKHYDALC